MLFQRFLYAAAALLLSSPVWAQPLTLQVEDPRVIEASLENYLPADETFDSKIPVPSSVLGFEVGERHVRHDQLVTYMKELAESSNRVTVQSTGRSHERRELLLLTITSPENQARIEAIRDQHLALSDSDASKPNTADMPVVVYLGYGIHGNEASGSNASLLVAYHLAAGQSYRIQELLKNTIVLLDPSMNPDGLGRFAQWANSHRGEVAVADPEHREHREGWPNGRTNHYGFDLNRDWLPAQHPASQARLRSFHAWKPNVLADFHEMGTNSTYFFQPGVPSRNNPLTPKRNQELTQELATWHAKALDGVGSLYYSQESFDDFYYGKGSTYPDVNGAVGILFEQASSRGHLQESLDGRMNFAFTIRNQYLTSFSTLEGAQANRTALLDYQAEFHREAPPADIAGWVFGTRDRARLHHLAEVLQLHGLRFHSLKREVEINGKTFRPGEAFVALTDQPQHRLLRAMFETRVEFADETFYDVSTWTFPLAFGIDYALLEEKGSARQLAGERVDELEIPRGNFHPSPDAYAYLFRWDDFYSPRALHQLQEAGIRTRVATHPLKVVIDGQEKEYPAGSILVPVGMHSDRKQLEKALGSAAAANWIDIHPVTTGLTGQGPDLGSPTLEQLKPPQIALVVGPRVSTYDSAEIWHLLDHRFRMPVTLLRIERVASVDLDRYTHLVLVDGDYNRGLDRRATEAVRDWVRGGGILIANRRAVPWADRKLFPDRLPEKKEGKAKKDEVENPHSTRSDIASSPSRSEPAPKRRAYADYRPDSAVHLISGAIFEVELDLTHPLAFGYNEEQIPVFRNTRIFLEAEGDPYVTVARYSEDPLLSGYISDENLARLGSTPALTAHRVGEGLIVRMVDNPSFRAFWYGTQKLFLNAIFFGNVVDDTSD